MASLIIPDVNITQKVIDMDTKTCPVPPPLYLVSDFERNFRCSVAIVYMIKYWYIPWVTVTLYVSAVILGRRLMDMRGKPFDLKRYLILWNAGLAIFSICGTLRMVPLFQLAYDKGLQYTLTHDGYPSCKGQCLWAILFLLSKFVELGDTAFIILRRRPVTFLHVYHHSTVLVFTYWMGSITTAGLLPQFMAINYTIHAFMYSYFTLMAYGIRVPKKIAIAITCAQIMQMFYGVYVTIATYHYTKNTGVPFELKVSVCVYASYAVLFINFFLQAYFIKPKQQVGKKAVNGTANGTSKVQYSVDGQKLKAN